VMLRRSNERIEISRPFVSVRIVHGLFAWANKTQDYLPRPRASVAASKTLQLMLM
jgi:hypothetical protein